MSLNQDRQIELKLHILAANDMSMDKWISEFRTDEEIEFALGSDELSKLSNMNYSLYEKAINRLSQELNKEYLEESVDSQGEAPLANKPVPVKTLPHVESNYVPTQNQCNQIRLHVTVETVETDKGTVYNYQSWKEKFLDEFKALGDSAETTFAYAVLNLGLDPSVEYISASKKKAIMKEFKKLRDGE